ncbi:MAG: hypothetical protein J0I41_13725 [Filimonas sp.]|nr:hypothetical protein [Filimonas sp.]
MKLKLTLPFLLLAVAIFGGCTKNTTHERYTIYRPIYQEESAIISNIKATGPTSITTPSKIYMRGNYVFISEALKGIHVIDISNVTAPQNVAFINILGNNDIAIKDNILLADCGKTLVSIDITNPASPKVVNALYDALPIAWYGGLVYDGSKVIVGWTKKDTVFTMSDEEFDRYKNTTARGWMIYASASNSSGANPGGSNNGVAGSLSRFGVINDYLYSIGSSLITTINVQNPSSPAKVSTVTGSGVMETIFPLNDSKFLVGTQTGMLVFDITNRQTPAKLGSYTHSSACDPVIADNQYAYITLKAGTPCSGVVNQLEIVDISNFQSIKQVKTYQMKHPAGLSKDGNTLFVCDDTDGLKVFNAVDVNNVAQIAQLKNFTPKDIIASGGKGLVIANEGFYMIDYTNLSNIHVTGKLQ